MTQLTETLAYAYRILHALITGELENGLRVSFLIDGSPRKTQSQIRKALQILEEDGLIRVESKGRGRPPARIYLQRGVGNA
jgi:hypothetical protein